MSSPITPPSASYATQAGYATNAGLLARFSECLAQTAEYIINTESSGTTNHADRAIMARIIAANTPYWANTLGPLLVADGTITTSSTDVNIADQVWLLWPVISYNASTVLPTGPGTP